MDVTAHPTRPGLFLTRDGRVFQELAVSPSSGGYRTVKTGKTTIRRHTLMAETFCGTPPEGAYVVRHLDGNSTNDNPDNLAWGTPQENAQDMVRHGRTTRGESNAQHKLTQEEAKSILERRRRGESAASLAREFGVAEGTVCDIFKRRTWPELDGGEPSALSKRDHCPHGHTYTEATTGWQRDGKYVTRVCLICRRERDRRRRRKGEA